MRAFLGYLADTMAIGPIREFEDTLLRRRAQGLPFPVPIHHLYARRDPMVPPRFGAILAARTAAPLTWLDEGSHFAHVDAVEKWLPPVLDFLS